MGWIDKSVQKYKDWDIRQHDTFGGKKVYFGYNENFMFVTTKDYKTISQVKKEIDRLTKIK